MKDIKSELIALMLEELRITYRGNVADAARSWDVPYDNLYKWVNGKRMPRFETLEKIMSRLQNEQCLKSYAKLVKSKTMPLLFDNFLKKAELDSNAQRKIQLYSIPVFDIANAAQDIANNSPLYQMDIPSATADYADFALIVDNDDFFPFIPHLSIVGVAKNYKFYSGKTFVLNLGVEGYVLREGTYKRAENCYYFNVRRHDRRDLPEEIAIKTQDELEKIVVGQIVWILKRPILV